MNELPPTVSLTIAQWYQNDARDFLKRFDATLEPTSQFTARAKSFVDLLMGCECALKCHVFLGRREASPRDTYREVRKAGHKVRLLSQLADYMTDRSVYDAVADNLEPFDVSLRYSLDAYPRLFRRIFSHAQEQTDSKNSYFSTIGRDEWLLGVREHLDQLIKAVGSELVDWIFEADATCLRRHTVELRGFISPLPKQ